jgi:putative hemolysin
VYPTFPELLPGETLREGRYEVRFARTAEELDAVLRLRFEVFNLELEEGLESSFETGRDLDQFDPVCHHLVVAVQATGEVVGTYRLQTSAMAAAHPHGFYSATEFDLDGFPPPVVAGSVELGRACVALEHRNTQVLFLLWKGLALYVRAARKRYLFGCCSLTSQDPREGRNVMDHLERTGRVHPRIRIAPQAGFECYGPDLELDPGCQVKLPKLFRIYLRHGALVCGPPAIDRQFKTIDYLVLFDVDAMSERQVRTFFG